ncbi:MAG TPA: heme ABC transporter ATP-binding protein [Blastocatellia bacterium]|nr:heme ABC transporter ATP-binding protein [Blastocatellia bacterium]
MSALLTARDLSFAYGHRPILRGVSLTVEAGEFVGLIGANGSGKTTLLRALLGLLPASGEVRLCGDPLPSLSRREIAIRATMAHQETRVDFAFAAREVVAMGRNPHLGRFTPEMAADREAIARAMRETKTEVLAERPVTELSGGERQRVHLARALAQETRIILLDEPTANLDLAHQFDALQLVKDFARSGGAVLAAIHDLTLAARFSDRLLLLSEGRIVADGPPGAVLTEEHLSRHFALRARIWRDEETGSLIVYPLGTHGDQK